MIQNINNFLAELAQSGVSYGSNFDVYITRGFRRGVGLPIMERSIALRCSDVQIPRKNN